MVNWILVILVVFLILFIFLKVEHAGKRVKFIFLILFIAFLYFSVTSVLHSTQVKLNSVEGVTKVTTMYFSWLTNAATNVWHAAGDSVKTVGNAIKMNSTSTRK